MDDPKRSSLLSQLIPDEIEKSLGIGDNPEETQASLLASTLKMLAGSNRTPLAEAVNEFLDGRGNLLETTRASLARGPKTAEREVASFLSETLNLDAAVARTVAPLLIRIFPVVGKLAGAGAVEKPKPRRKKKTTASSSAKPAASRPKKPKTTTGKPKKPKTSATSKPAPASKPRRRKTTA